MDQYVQKVQVVELSGCRASGRRIGVSYISYKMDYYVSLRVVALHRLSGYVSLRRDCFENCSCKTFKVLEQNT